MSVVIKDLSFSLSEFKFGPRHFEFETTGLYLLRGKNGAGKTSLLRCLLGRIRKETGIIEGLQFPVGTCGLENLFIGSWNIVENINWLCELGGFKPSPLPGHLPLKRQVDRLSLGQKRQAELHFTLNLPVQTIFLDEPFNHLDQDHIKNSASNIQIASKSKLILMTSHQDIASLQFTKVFDL
jgi:ABC-type multidrug transport system ATPase subunit